MVKSSTTSITPTQHAANHVHGGTDPLTGDIRIDSLQFTTSTDETAARAVDGTIYRNTSGRTMFVSVVLDLTFNATYACQVFVENATPPTILVSEYRENVIANSHDTLTFLVADDDYYMVDGTMEANNCALTSWIEHT